MGRIYFLSPQPSMDASYKTVGKLERKITKDWPEKSIRIPNLSHIGRNTALRPFPYLVVLVIFVATTPKTFTDMYKKTKKK